MNFRMVLHIGKPCVFMMFLIFPVTGFCIDSGCDLVSFESILAPFRSLVANLPFLLKTHGAYTRALILKARAIKIHHFWAPFSASFLDTFWVPKMEAKWEPKWHPEKQKIAFGGFCARPWGPKVPKKRSQKRSRKWTPGKSHFL